MKNMKEVKVLIATIIWLFISNCTIKANPINTNDQQLLPQLNIETVGAQNFILDDTTESVSLEDLLSNYKENTELTIMDTTNQNTIIDSSSNDDVPLSAGVTTIMDSELSEDEINTEEKVSNEFEKVVIDFIEIPEMVDCSYRMVNEYEMYAIDYLKVRTQPYTETEDNILDILHPGKCINIIGEREDNWAAIKYEDQIAFVCLDYLSFEKPIEATYNYEWTGEKLNTINGIVSGPNGNETYYNLNMSHIVEIMRDKGYNYEYWVREDGVKMFGDYIMCAADLNIRPKGTIIESTLGTCIVVDTGGFVSYDNTRLDIAVTW